MTEQDYKEINPCGVYCYNCPDLNTVCDGCRNRKGTPIWYKLYNKTEPCVYYTCCEEKIIHNCSACNKVPCSNHFVFPDPNMSDEEKEMWLERRMNNFMLTNKELKIQLSSNYTENEKRFTK